MSEARWLDSVFSDGTELFLDPVNPVIGEAVTIKMRVWEKSPVKKVYIRFLLNGEETVKQMDEAHKSQGFQYYSYTMQMKEPTFLYRFIVVTKESVYFYTQKGVALYSPLETHDFKLLMNFKRPKWIQESIFYQIFPDRFCNGNPKNDVKPDEYSLNGFNTTKKEWDTVPADYEVCGNLDFYGGDLEGIQDKITYLKQLGVSVLYINPIFKAYSNHKYDCLDYFNVDSHLGGNSALSRLCKALHDHDMRIILDISINHTGKEHSWIKDKTEYYYQDEMGEFEYWCGVKDLPTLNYENDQLKKIIYKDQQSALKKWLQPPYMIDGWRFDVGQSVGKMKQSVVDQELWKEIRTELKDVNPDMYFLVEHWDDCIRYLQGDMWDASMNYCGFNRPLRKYLGQNDPYLNWKIQGVPLRKKNATIFMKESRTYFASLPYQIQVMNFNLIDSHDISRLGCIPEVSKANKETAVVMLFTFLGVPNIYYGDEIELPGRLGSDAGIRYPMEWDDQKWDQNTLTLYKKMIKLRNESELIKYGSFKYIEVAQNVLCYARFNGQQAMLVINSQHTESKTIEVDCSTIGVFQKVMLWHSIGEISYEWQENKLYLQLGSESTGVFCLD